MIESDLLMIALFVYFSVYLVLFLKSSCEPIVGQHYILLIELFIYISFAGM